MLTTDSTSSVQKRRQHHRRQQSLEVPIVATPLHANHRPKRTTHGHQRGLSLDQSLSAHNSPAGFRQLISQDQDQGPTPPHIKQETQQHRPAQPGYQAQDFQAHLQQQLNGNVNTNILSPTPLHPHQQQQALQDLQQHMAWYQQNFAQSGSPNMHSHSFFTVEQPVTNGMEIHPHEAQMPQDLVELVAGMPTTPVSHGHSHTVPNTPQHYVQSWPSPPPSNVKHARSQSFQCDVAPMPTSPEPAHSPCSHPHGSFTQGSFTIGGDSVYSSSITDPMSPGRQQNMGPMPTLFEDSILALGTPTPQHGLPDGTLLPHAAAHVSDDFNSPNFVIGGATAGLSPNSALLVGLGDDVNCSIIDTGITPEQVEANISAPVDSPKDKNVKIWHCLFEEDGQRCGKEFKRNENARSHVQNHLNDRKYMCNDCGKTFVRAHDMKRHAAIHKDERPHVCPCGQMFARHDALTRHRQRGMCTGTLPGFEKTEEEKPKRGRPKKERPDKETRTTKANKARQMDRQMDRKNENLADSVIGMDFNYASSSSGLSEHSLPMTPPDTSDFDADVFLNMANIEYTGNAWRDTPPTSPVNAHPGVAMMDIYSDVLTPESDPTIASSPITCGAGAETVAPGDWSRFFEQYPINRTTFDEDKGLSTIEAWISSY